MCDRLGPAPYAPAIDPANFVSTIDNPLFPLVPGTTFIYDGQTADGLELDELRRHPQHPDDLDVTCVEVHDTVTVDGRLTEDTLDWFCAGRGRQRLVLRREFAGSSPMAASSWARRLVGRSGVDGAQPGIVMEAHPDVGDFYRQEFLLGDAEDLAEVASLDESVTVLSDNSTFPHCLKTTETSPLEPDALENKFYAAGVGNLLTIESSTGEKSELVQIMKES